MTTASGLRLGQGLGPFGRGLPDAIRARLAAARLPMPVALYLFAVVVPIGFNVGPLLLTTVRLLLLILVIPLTIKLFLGRFGRIYFTDVLFLLHIIWAVMALAVNNPDRVVEQAGSVGVEFLGGYLVGRAYIRTPEAFSALCRALGLIVFCTFPIALFETTTGRPLLLEIVKMIPSALTVEFNYQDQRMGLNRVQMGFAHPIHYGLFCSVAFSLVFVGLENVMGLGRRIVTTAVIGLCGFLALSSGALLALALQIGLIGWSLVFARVKGRWWILVGLFALMYVAIDLFSNRTPLKVFMSYATFSAHTAYWRSIIFEWGMKNVWANPFFGIGLNDWVRPYYMYSGSMDNFWLVLAVRYGIPGFLLLTIGYMISIARIMRRNFRDDLVLNQMRRAWVFTFLGLSFTLCTVHVWGNVYSFTFFMFGAGMWLIEVAPGTRDDAMPGPSAPGRPAVSHTRFAPVRRGDAAGLTGMSAIRNVRRPAR